MLTDRFVPDQKLSLEYYENVLKLAGYLCICAFDFRVHFARRCGFRLDPPMESWICVDPIDKQEK